RLIDLCCGTGASTRALARHVPNGSVIGVDFSQAMLEVAQRRPLPNLSYQQADVLQLPFPDATFDGASMAFSMRNVVDIGACLREIARVLKPGGRFVNLEVNKPAQPLLRRLFFIYFYGVIPTVGGLVGGDANAYRYLPQSLINFPGGEALAELFRANGFAHVRTASLMGGVAAVHAGESIGAAATHPAPAYAASPLSASPA
ncbi:MAG: ubiquinone/menaquinone biosynthesis methyltransferase, partial [Candidatus Eremiobacteraeota bacterium]|nr:ubiquinone/menaquinone biosynthesis methyltransferase [Candidatus Eremiobacteraeota bacterium]